MSTLVVRVIKVGVVLVLAFALIVPVVIILYSIEGNAGASRLLPFLPGFRGARCEKYQVITQLKQNLLPRKGGTVHSLFRASGPSLDERKRVSVPQTIWQTARSKNDTPPLAIDLFNSWTQKNPGYDHFFLDDEAVNELVGSLYNDTVALAFEQMPLGVMRADAVRYMMLYHYGGVYADMDTKCLQPIETWAPKGCYFAVALENKEHLCQWAFASTAGHGALRHVLDLVIRRMLDPESYKGDHFVHHITGPGVFTEGILTYLGMLGAAGKLDELLEDHRDSLRERGVCLMSSTEMAEALQNFYASQRDDLKSTTWVSWTDEGNAFRAARDAEAAAAADGQDEDVRAGEDGEESAHGGDARGGDVHAGEDAAHGAEQEDVRDDAEAGENTDA